MQVNVFDLGIKPSTVPLSIGMEYVVGIASELETTFVIVL
jgi:hypothetical protein